MRRFLDGLYGAAGLLAGLCTIGVLVSVLAAIVARQLGLNIPCLLYTSDAADE